MAIKKYSEITGMNSEVLEKDLAVNINDLHRLRLEHKVKGLQNPVQIKYLRREIARMKTELSKRATTQS
jgi:large subunit ribosomal protein L29